MSENTDSPVKSDQELAALCLKSPDYLPDLIGRYQEPLFYYLRRLTGQPTEDLEDLLQEIFIKMYRNLNDYQPDLKFSSWLYRIAHNQAISHWRAQKIRPQLQLQDFAEDSESHISQLAGDLNLEHNFDRQILQQKVVEILTRLDEKYREVLVLRFFEDQSYQEIADILQKPAGTIAALISRAKVQFQNLFNSQPK